MGKSKTCIRGVRSGRRRRSGNYDPALKVDSFADTSPVGSFAVNRFGLFDLGGNAWEWCEDFYDGSSAARVLRGGSWGRNDSGFLLSSSRIDVTADGRYDFVGFRCVLVGVSSR